MTGAISQNVGKLFSEVKIVTDNQLIFQLKHQMHERSVPIYKKQIGCFNLNVITLVAN